MACVCLKSLSGVLLHGMCLFKINTKAVFYGVCLKSLSGLFLHGMYLFEITIRAVFVWHVFV